MNGLVVQQLPWWGPQDSVCLGWQASNKAGDRQLPGPHWCCCRGLSAGIVWAHTPSCACALLALGPPCRQVADAIPIPGLLETLSSSSSGGGGSGGAPGGLPLPLPSNEQVLAALAASPAAGLLMGGDTQLVAQATPALEQLSSVVQEVRRV